MTPKKVPAEFGFYLIEPPEKEKQEEKKIANQTE